MVIISHRILAMTFCFLHFLDFAIMLPEDLTISHGILAIMLVEERALLFRPGFCSYFA